MNITQPMPPNRAAADSPRPSVLDMVPATGQPAIHSSIRTGEKVRLLTVATATAAVLGLASACSPGPAPGPSPTVTTTTPAPPTTTPVPPTTTPVPPTTTPVPPTTTPAPPTITIPPAPRELVGTWHNDPGDVDWFFSVAEDGSYTLHSTDIQVYDEGFIDTSDGSLRLLTTTEDPRPSRVVVDPAGCGWTVDSMELFGYVTTQLQLCDRAAWVKG